jgi:hypothetical protein
VENQVHTTIKAINIKTILVFIVIGIGVSTGKDRPSFHTVGGGLNDPLFLFIFSE